MRKEMRKIDGKGATNASVELEYRARSEVDKPKLTDLIKVSLTRPICESPVYSHVLQASDLSFQGFYSVGSLSVSSSRRYILTSIPRYLAEPIVASFSVWISMAWGVFYALTQSIPLIFQELYGFDTGHTGLVYLSMS
jgi:hypothetical protein